MESQRLLVRGQYMGVTMSSQPGKQSPPTLVLIHGFTGSTASWTPLFPALEASGRRLIALDMPGHGLTDAPDDPACYSIESSQAAILEVLAELGVRQNTAVLLGYSMGGRIALYTALSGFFRALILESASPGLSDPVARAQRKQSDDELAERIEREGITAFVDDWEKLPLFASQSDLPLAVQATQRAQRLQNNPSGLANSLRGVGTGVQPALHQRLHELHLPVLLLAGELDPKFSQLARQMAARLPQAHLHIVAGAGHTIHLEQAALFLHLVEQFCDTVYPEKAE